MEDFWGVVTHGIHHRFSEAVMKTILRDIQALDKSDISLVPVLENYRDIHGATIWLDLKAVPCIYESTPDIRDSERSHNTMCFPPDPEY